MEKSLTLDWGTDELHEECGVFGMYDLDGNDVASTIYYGLFALQHRGQESCGIAVSDTYGPKGVVNACKGMGLCNEVFTSEKLGKIKRKHRCRPCPVFDCRKQHNREYTAARFKLCEGNSGTGTQWKPCQCAGASQRTRLRRSDFPDHDRL